ncbi:MAG: hypothetical protein Q8O14_14735 [bacterium]|nr:hypothetical protein [bacterium]
MSELTIERGDRVRLHTIGGYTTHIVTKTGLAAGADVAWLLNKRCRVPMSSLSLVRKSTADDRYQIWLRELAMTTSTMSRRAFYNEHERLQAIKAKLELDVKHLNRLQPHMDGQPATQGALNALIHQRDTAWKRQAALEEQVLRMAQDNTTKQTSSWLGRWMAGWRQWHRSLGSSKD